MTRSVLQVVQSAAPKLGISVPAALFAVSDRTEVELASVLNEVATRILKSHDWSALKVKASNAGDGSTEEYSLPDDYQRMPKDGQVWSSRWQRPLLPISVEDDLRLEVREYDQIVGTWLMIGGKIKFRPALASDETANWYYVSSHYANSEAGGTAGAFINDFDTFRLDDHTLELQLISEWRYRKGLDYAEDMRSAELALAQAISDDKGARIITQSSRRNVRATPAYPWQITP